MLVFLPDMTAVTIPIFVAVEGPVELEAMERAMGIEPTTFSLGS